MTNFNDEIFLDKEILNVDDFLFNLRVEIIESIGMKELSIRTGMGKESLYKTLRPATDPGIKTLSTILRSLQLNLKIVEGRKDYSPDIILSGSLIYDFPKIVVYWDKKKNKISPLNVTSKSKIKVYWKCHKYESHSWMQTINSRCKQADKYCKICEDKNKRDTMIDINESR